MQIDRLDDVRSARVASGRRYEEFLRRPSMSAGLYELAVGVADPQTPHAEDELYHIISGTARFECEGELRTVGPGDTIFVAAGAPHRFVEITTDLTVLVVFAPAESS